MGGETPQRCHRVWVAFLRYKNDEYESEKSMRDYILFPMNWLTVQATGWPYIHCQLVIWDEIRKQYVTFSVDNKRPVHVYDKKTFRAGWDFIELGVTEQEELLIYNFLVAQLGKPLNTSGQMLSLVLPSSGRGHTWFCSELVAAALDHAGLIDYKAWPGIKEAAAVAPHHLYIYLTRYCLTCTITKLEGNPVSVASIHRAAVSAGKISLSEDRLPTSVVQHAAPAPPPPALLAIDLSEQLANMPLPAPDVLSAFVIRR